MLTADRFLVLQKMHILWASYETARWYVDNRFGKIQVLQKCINEMVDLLPGEKKSSEMLKMAQPLFQETKYTSCRTLVIQALTLDDFETKEDQTQARYLGGQCFYALGDLPQAISCLWICLHHKPDFQEARMLLGFCYYHEHRYQTAIQTWEKVDTETARHWIQEARKILDAPPSPPSEDLEETEEEEEEEQEEEEGKDDWTKREIQRLQWRVQSLQSKVHDLESKIETLQDELREIKHQNQGADGGLGETGGNTNVLVKDK